MNGRLISNIFKLDNKDLRSSEMYLGSEKH